MNRRPSMTLIEVVAALVLTATAATAMLTAHGRSLDQLRRTGHLDHAATLAHERITLWQLSGSHTIAAEGRFDNEPRWRWRTMVEPYSAVSDLVLQRVTLSIQRTDGVGQAKTVARYTWLERMDADE